VVFMVSLRQAQGPAGSGAGRLVLCTSAPEPAEGHIAPPCQLRDNRPSKTAMRIICSSSMRPRCSAGRGLQPRPQCFVNVLPDGVCNPVRNVLSMFCRLPDGVCNPVRNVLSIPGSISFGRGCKPRPAMSPVRQCPPSGNVPRPAMSPVRQCPPSGNQTLILPLSYINELNKTF